MNLSHYFFSLRLMKSSSCFGIDLDPIIIKIAIPSKYFMSDIPYIVSELILYQFIFIKN